MSQPPLGFWVLDTDNVAASSWYSRYARVQFVLQHRAGCTQDPMCHKLGSGMESQMPILGLPDCVAHCRFLNISFLSASQMWLMMLWYNCLQQLTKTISMKCTTQHLGWGRVALGLSFRPSFSWEVKHGKQCCVKLCLGLCHLLTTPSALSCGL